MKFVGLTAVIGFALGVAAAAHAAYPGKPVRVVIGFPPGGAIDITARVVTHKLSEIWGQAVTVENRPGAGGSIGAAAVAKSAPDGHTLLVHSNGYAVNAALYPSLPFDPAKDLVAVAPLGSQPFVLVVGAASERKTVAALIAAAKAKPGQLHYGSAGLASATHFVAERFVLAAGIEAVHVPYKGGPDATADTITGRIDYWFAPLPFALPYLRDGRLWALGVTSASRARLLPDTPTIAEAGLEGFEDRIWFGVWAPGETPPSLAGMIARDVARAVQAPDVLDRFAKFGTEPMAMTPDEFRRFVRAEIESAARLVRAAGIKAQ